MSLHLPQPETHPAERFSAPTTIQRGSSLADLIGRSAIELLAESMARVASGFDANRFQRRAIRGLASRGLMERATHVANALSKELPTDFDAAANVLVASLGPELKATEGNGLAPFFYLPHSAFIAQYGVACPDQALWACYELTKRFTAEFCLRPLLVECPSETLKVLETWTADLNPHVRRAVSEGTRPRLPWGIRLKAFQNDPGPTLALLEKLKDDSVPYVQRSVANHLGDILKDNPSIGYATCERWVDESSDPNFTRKQAGRRLWIVRHALRLPAKKGDLRAIRLRERAKNS